MCCVIEDSPEPTGQELEAASAELARLSPAVAHVVSPLISASVPAGASLRIAEMAITAVRSGVDEEVVSARVVGAFRQEAGYLRIVRGDGDEASFCRHEDDGCPESLAPAEPSTDPAVDGTNDY